MYHNKYNKYKQKYLELKQYGGAQQTEHSTTVIPLVTRDNVNKLLGEIDTVKNVKDIKSGVIDL